MLRKYIFGPPADNPDEGLWAVLYLGDTIDIFEQIFDDWNDPDKMYKFCKENIEDLKKVFGAAITPAAAANKLMEEAVDLENELYEASQTATMAENLQSLFKPLDDRSLNITELQCSKARAGKNRKKGRSVSCLRIYAIRINANTYLVTGGAVKLTKKMSEREHTRKEVMRLEEVLAFLQREHILYPEDLNAES